MAWIKPKTNWTVEGVTHGDFNRIENNIDYLNSALVRSTSIHGLLDNRYSFPENYMSSQYYALCMTNLLIPKDHKLVLNVTPSGKSLPNPGACYYFYGNDVDDNFFPYNNNSNQDTPPSASQSFLNNNKLFGYDFTAKYGYYNLTAWENNIGEGKLILISGGISITTNNVRVSTVIELVAGISITAYAVPI